MKEKNLFEIKIYMHMCYGFIIVKINCYWLPVKVCFQEWNLWPFKLLSCAQIIFWKEKKNFFEENKKLGAICLHNNFVKRLLLIFQSLMQQKFKGEISFDITIERRVKRKMMINVIFLIIHQYISVFCSCWMIL